MDGVVIQRPALEVATFMFDPANDPLWTGGGVVAFRPLGPDRVVAGSVLERAASFLGRRYHQVVEVTDRIEGRSLELSITRPFRLHLRYELAAVPGGTWTSIVARSGGAHLVGLTAPLLREIVRHGIQADLAKLQAHLEEPRGSNAD
jgi:hypothetical protein